MVEEASFQLEVTPHSRLEFVGPLGRAQTVTLTVKNKSHHRQAFKVKCTANELFRIRPPVGCLEGSQVETVSIEWKGLTALGLNEPPPNEQHHVGIYHIPAPDGAGPRGVWAEHHGPPVGTHRVHIYFKETPEKPSS